MRAWTFQPAADAPKLHAVSWESPSPKACVFFHHGIAEHCEREGYKKVFTSLSEQGISVHSFDARGHGKSELNPKERVKIAKFDTIVSDFVEFCKSIREDASSPKVPCFISGHSMGGLVCAHAAIDNQDWFNGMLLFSPALDVDKTVILRVQSLLGAPLGFIAPWARLVPAVRIEDISESEEVRKNYMEDPMNFPGDVRVRTALQVESAMNRLKPRYKEFQLPCYDMHGEQDKCTSIRGHKNFFAAISSSDKTMNMVAGGFHELLQGPQKEECTQSIAAWILSRLNGPQIKTPL